jgi:hypothetical protein
VRTILFSVFSALALALSLTTTALAAEPAVARVVVVQTDNADAYIKELAHGDELLKKMGSQAKTIHVWRARFAGPETGTVVVTIEYPNLAAVASDDAKIAASDEYKAWIKGLDKLRKIVSDSLYTQLK